MQQSVGQRPGMAPAVLGLLLIAFGGVALVLRTAGINLFESVGEWGWPLFVLIPGLVLLGLALIPRPPQGIGFAIAGSIVTAVGAILMYQSQTSHWESWAYVWALIPAAAGVAQVLYGALARDGAMVGRGAWMAGISALMFAVGAWFFEATFAGEQPWRNVEWWPVGLIVIGAIVLVAAFLRPAATTPPPAVGSAEPPVGQSPSA